MEKARKRRCESSCLSIVFFAVRNRHNPTMYYGVDDGQKGWVHGLKKATIWKNRINPCILINRFGKENAELVSIHGALKSVEFCTSFIIKNAKTGMYIRPNRNYDKAKLWTKHLTSTRSWFSRKRAERVVKHIIKRFPDMADELEIIPLQVFYERI